VEHEPRAKTGGGGRPQPPPVRCVCRDSRWFLPLGAESHVSADEPRGAARASTRARHCPYAARRGGHPPRSLAPPPAVAPPSSASPLVPTLGACPPPRFPGGPGACPVASPSLTTAAARAVVMALAAAGGGAARVGGRKLPPPQAPLPASLGPPVAAVVVAAPQRSLSDTSDASCDRAPRRSLPRPPTAVDMGGRPAADRVAMPDAETGWITTLAVSVPVRRCPSADAPGFRCGATVAVAATGRGGRGVSVPAAGLWGMRAAGTAVRYRVRPCASAIQRGAARAATCGEHVL